MTSKRAETLADLAAAYLVVSDQQALIDEVITRIRDRVAEEADLSLNLDEFDAAQAQPGDVIAAASVMPFLAEKRVVLVRNLEKWKTGELDKLADYLADPSPGTCLMAAFKERTRWEGKKPPVTIRRDSRLWTQAQLKGYLIHRQGPRFKSEYQTWVTERARHSGVRLDPSAAAYLLEAVGEDLGTLGQEITKLALVYGSGAKLDRDSVEAMVSGYDRAEMFDYIGDLFAGKTSQALADLRTLAVDQEPTVVLAKVADQLVDLIRTKTLLDRGAKLGEVKKELGMPDWKAKRLAEQASRFDLGALEGLFRSVVEYEDRIKTSRLDGRLALDRLTVEVARGATPR